MSFSSKSYDSGTTAVGDRMSFCRYVSSYSGIISGGSSVIVTCFSSVRAPSLPMDRLALLFTFLKESIDPLIELYSLIVAGVTTGSQYPMF